MFLPYTDFWAGSQSGMTAVTTRSCTANVYNLLLVRRVQSILTVWFAISGPQPRLHADCPVKFEEPPKGTSTPF
jgi:hypothetical protein